MLIDPYNMPTLEAIFGSDTKLMTAFRSAGIRTITPTMILPEGSLMSINGIADRTEKRITKRLHDAGIERRTVCVKLRTYLGDQFGSTNDAPLTALQVMIVRKDEINYPTFAPLQVVDFLDNLYPHMTIQDMLTMGEDGISYVVQGPDAPHEVEESHVRDLHQDLEHIRMRLNLLGLELPASATHPVKLQLVG